MAAIIAMYIRPLLLMSTERLIMSYEVTADIFSTISLRSSIVVGFCLRMCCMHLPQIQLSIWVKSGLQLG